MASTSSGSANMPDERASNGPQPARLRIRYRYVFAAGTEPGVEACVGLANAQHADIGGELCVERARQVSRRRGRR